MVRQYLYSVVPSMQDIVPWRCPIGVSRRAHNHAHQSTIFHVQFCEIIFVKACDEFLIASGVDATWCCHPCPMVDPSWVCGGGVGGLGSVKAIHSGGSHPCVVNELADAEAPWGAGTVRC